MNNNFAKLLSNLNIELNELQVKQFETYYQMLIEWNDKINLTSITLKEEVYTKHFFDSICLIKALPLSNQSLLDVGSGAGFPSIPLKIIFPDLKITIIDALNKRIKFLMELTKELDIDIELIHGRAEEFNRKNSYDLVTARAVANLRMLSELCIPFAKIGGYFIAMKGPSYKTELSESKNAIRILGGKTENTIEYEIENQFRSIIKIKKIEKTKDKYPRIFGKIKSKPL